MLTHLYLLKIIKKAESLIAREHYREKVVLSNLQLVIMVISQVKPEGQRPFLRVRQNIWKQTTPLKVR
jgi:hypothetical protein